MSDTKNVFLIHASKENEEIVVLKDYLETIKMRMLEKIYI